MTYATTLDVTCPSCGYEGPAALISVPETECFLEHWACVCPECARGWVLTIGDNT
jgi:hypothetical protein